MVMRICLSLLVAWSCGYVGVQAQESQTPTTAGSASGDPETGIDATIAQWNQAVASADATTVRDALKPVIALGASANDKVLPILVQAVGIAATHDTAVEALRVKTGLQPGLHNFGTGYPNYPLSDSAADWSTWLAQRTQDQTKERELDDHQRRLDHLEK